MDFRKSSISIGRVKFLFSNNYFKNQIWLNFIKFLFINKIITIFVMIGRENSSIKNKTHKTKIKNKPKSKSSYLQQGFLDMLIQLKNLESSNKKVKQIKHKKTLPIFIPQNQKKIGKRPHTSYQKYSKNQKQVLHNCNKINLQDAFTQQDNIEFTQLTPRESFHEHFQQQVYIQHKLNRDSAAIKIQRAWRNYQVYRMISKYKSFFSCQSKYMRQKVQQQNNSGKIRHRRSRAQINNQFRQQQNYYSSQSISQLEIKIIDGKISKSIGKNCQYSPVNLMTDSQNGQFSRTLKKEGCMNFTNHIQTPDSPVNQLDVFNKRNISGSPKTNPNIEALLNNIEDKLQQTILQNNIKELMEKIGDNKNIIKDALVNSPYSETSQQQLNLKPQQEILIKRKQLLKKNLQTKLTEYQQKLNDGHLSLEQYLYKKQLFLKKYQTQFRNIAKSRKLLTKYYNNFEHTLLSFQKQSSSSSSQLRKTFSAESIVLKAIIKDIQINKFEIEPQNQVDDYQDNQLEILQLQQRINSNLEINVSTLIQTKNQTADKITNEIIQTIYQQFISEVFFNTRVYKQFQPYIQAGFSFHKIQDFEIREFLCEMQKVFPQFSVMHKRLNQRINPNSQEILKILRNAQYYPEQYTLVLEQQCFRKYKKNLQQIYKNKRQRQIQSLKVIENVRNFELRIKLYEMTHEKVQKIKKLLTFEKDLKAMYMKSVFNCLNELFIQAKSFNTHMNTRSSIGPGQLSLALKQYNKYSSEQQVQQIIDYCFDKITKIVHYKIEDPINGMHLDIERFQMQIMKIISMQMIETQYKWVNYMDETLQLWLQTSVLIESQLLQQAANDFLIFL